MIKEENFVEYDVPMLYKIMTIKQPEHELSLEFWDHVVELFETYLAKEQMTEKEQGMSRTEREKLREKLSTKSVQLLFAKGKEGMLVIWRFENSSIINQKSIKIPYYLSKEISMIKAYKIEGETSILGSERLSSASKSGLYLNKSSKKIDILLLGYIDGTFEIFEIILTETSIQLSKCLQIKNQNEEPVTNAVIYDDSDLIVCRTHSIFMYPKLITDLTNKIVTKSKEKLNSSENLLRVKELIDSSRLSISLTNNNLHIYNELEGVFTFSLPEMKSEGSILDSIKCLEETPEGDLVIASADDCIKIIYSHSNEIEKIVGLKSFISSIQINQMEKEKLLEIWMADCYGELHYFLKQSSLTTSSNYLIKSNEKKKKEDQSTHEHQHELVMFETELSRSVKITENGIKKIILSNNMLLIVDSQMNLLLYDIVRNVQTLTEREST